ncbi:MAG: hypothetical protein KZQ91_11380 [Candidatus Thiodiazotropha sp. (ex Lucinoma borealis)]|nr:hypothetical protein [Candidatus Thiodiazotropha sp. (ex Lucinoma borealis)]
MLNSLYQWDNVLLWISNFILILFTFIYFKDCLYKKAIKVSNKQKYYRSYLGYVFIAALFYLPATFVIYSLIEISGVQPGWIDILLLIVSLLIMILSNQLLIIKLKEINIIVWYIVVISISLLSLLFTTSSWSLIPSALTRINHVGNIPNVNIVAQGNICLALPDEVYLKADKSKLDETSLRSMDIPLCEFKQLKILSTLGKDLYLEYSSDVVDEAKTKTIHHFTISKQNVVTLHTETEKKELRSVE